MRRVVVTGMGVISPIGNDIKTFEKNIDAGVCGIDYIHKFDASDMPVKVDAEVKDFNAKAYFDSVSEIRKADLYTQYAVAAASQAVNMSGIMESDIDKNRLGVYIGTGIGGINSIISEAEKCEKRGPDRVSPFFVPMMISNMASGTISIKYGAKGPTLPVVTACATSSNTIGEAYRAIKHGYADAIIAGGSEAAINKLAMAGFVSCQALSLSENPNEGCRPFDADRNGFVMSEGAGVLVLEDYESAVARNAKIYGEIVGYGNTADAYHITAPDPDADGAARAIKLAVDEAGITDASSTYVNAHGTGTHMNDAMETKALKKVFGEEAYKLHVSSSKSMTGHMLGAAGAVEAIVCILALNKGLVPPTINLNTPDPECDLDYTPGKAVEADLKYAVSSSLGFGGHNACIAFKKF